MLQLRLADMKKTLQQELRTPGNPNYHTDLLESNMVAVLTPSQISTRNFPSVVRRDEDDVNFKYLKHVVIKFLTSREYEAQHLIKAISTLLKFTPEEEKLIQDTLEWKKSWFGSKPKFPVSQKAKNFSHSWWLLWEILPETEAFKILHNFKALFLGRWLILDIT